MQPSVGEGYLCQLVSFALLIHFGTFKYISVVLASLYGQLLLLRERVALRSRASSAQSTRNNCRALRGGGRMKRLLVAGGRCTAQRASGRGEGAGAAGRDQGG
jgi:hypothetical protein